MKNYIILRDISIEVAAIFDKYKLDFDDIMFISSQMYSAAITKIAESSNRKAAR